MPAHLEGTHWTDFWVNMGSASLKRWVLFWKTSPQLESGLPKAFTLLWRVRKGVFCFLPFRIVLSFLSLHGVHFFLFSPLISPPPILYLCHKMIALVFLLYLLHKRKSQTGDSHSSASIVCSLSFSVHFLPSPHSAVLLRCCSLESLTARNRLDFSMINSQYAMKQLGGGEIPVWLQSAILKVTTVGPFFPSTNSQLPCLHNQWWDHTVHLCPPQPF